MGRARWSLVVLAVAVGSAVAAPGPAGAGVPDDLPAAGFAVPDRPGGAVTVPGWRMQTSAVATGDGSALSDPAYDDGGWLRVPARSTVMAGLVANRKYPDLNYSTNLRDQVNPADFAVPWWYRTTFQGGRPRQDRAGVRRRGDLGRRDLAERHLAR